MAGPTLLRTPRMDARSGVWLEGFSKRDAQAMLIVIPWAVVVSSASFHLTLYILEVLIPSLIGLVQLLERGVYWVLGLACLAYLPVAVLCERSCCCLFSSGPRRTLEGWLALVPPIWMSACAIMYAYGTHHNEGDHATMDSLVVVHGSLPFRAAATAEFLLQLVWLWAADRLRYEGRRSPRWKGWARVGLTLLWCLTFFGPWTQDEAPQPYEHVLVLVGYLARVGVFGYCVAHTCRRCARRCCCGCLQDWQTLKDVPCTPGRQRLRYLAYHILARPQFLLLVHVPLGYPLAFCAAFATTVRCAFALLLAVALRPAPRAAIGEHQLEAETRTGFDVGLASRLADFANETYIGPPPPQTVHIKNAARASLNGEYLLEGRDAAGCPIYTMAPPATEGSIAKEGIVEGWRASSSTVGRGPAALGTIFLRRTQQGTEWEISPNADSKSGVRWASVRDGAASPEQVQGLWFELREGELASNPELTLTPEWDRQRRFERHGSCRQYDAHWLLVEEEGILDEPGKLGLDANGPQGLGVDEAASAKETGEADIVSIVVAFRGTNSLQNALADARISLRPLCYQASSSSNPSVPLDLDKQVRAELARQLPNQVQEASQATSSRSTASDSLTPSVLSDGSAALLTEESRRAKPAVSERRLLQVDVQDAEEGLPSVPSRRRQSTVGPQADSEASRNIGCGCCFLCRILGRFCGFVVVPFLASDVEQDDEDFSTETLERVRVHIGFSRTYASIRDDVIGLLEDRLQSCKEEGKVPRLYITGHSLGAAVATLFALDVVTLLRGRGTELNPTVYTYGCPRLGNAAFRSIYNAIVPDTYRVVASRDIVPTLPPSIMYRQLGREVWLDDAGGLTFAMSWAMRHILPARDGVRYHSLFSYYLLLGRAFRQRWKRRYASCFQNEAGMRESLPAQ